MHFHPVRISMTLSRLSQRFAFFKIRLQQLLKAQFTAQVKTLDCDVIYSIQDECCSLVISQRKKHLENRYMEADTIIFYIYAKLR